MPPKPVDRSIQSWFFPATCGRLYLLCLVALVALVLAFVPYDKLIKGASTVDPKTGIDYSTLEFRGNAKQAMNLLTATVEDDRKRGRAFFLSHPGEAGILAQEIVWQMQHPVEKRTYSFEDQSHTYWEQRAWVETLALVEKQRPTGTLASLVNELLTWLETAPLGNPIPAEGYPITRCGLGFKVVPPGSPFSKGDQFNWGDFFHFRAPEEEEIGDHSLTWLLQELPRDEAAQRWGARLLKLKERRTRWQPEAALAVDMLRLELASELAAGLARMEQSTPVRSDTGVSISGTRVYFSTDHRRLWSFGHDGSLSRWDPETMKLIDHRDRPTGKQPLSIAEPGGQFAFFAPPIAWHEGDSAWSIPPPLEVSWIDAESGETGNMVLKVSAQSGYRWLRDGHLVISNGETLALIDLARGKIVREVPGPRRRVDAYIPYYASVDHRYVLLGSWGKGIESIRSKIDFFTGALTEIHSMNGYEGKPHEERVTIDGLEYYRLDDSEGLLREAHHSPHPPTKLPNLRGLDVPRIVQSGDRRRLAILTLPEGSVDHWDQGGEANLKPVVRIYDTESLRMIAAFHSSSPNPRMRLSPNGSQIVLIHDDKYLERWTIPD